MPPRNLTSRITSSHRAKIPAQRVYSPPSPNESCSGTATSVNTNAATPRTKLFVATAADERPGLASTRYATVLEYIHLKLSQTRKKKKGGGGGCGLTYVVKKPMKKSAVHRDATWMRSCASHAYAITDSGRNTIAGLVLSKRIYPFIRVAFSTAVGGEHASGKRCPSFASVRRRCAWSDQRPPSMLPSMQPTPYETRTSPILSAS